MNIDEEEWEEEQAIEGIYMTDEEMADKYVIDTEIMIALYRPFLQDLKQADQSGTRLLTETYRKTKMMF